MISQKGLDILELVVLFFSRKGIFTCDQFSLEHGGTLLASCRGFIQWKARTKSGRDRIMI